jgi:AraC family transcriptional regulator
MDFILDRETTSGDARLSEVRDLVCSVVELLDTAKLALDTNRDVAEASIARASSLLRIELDRRPLNRPRADSRNSLLAWQARRVCDYIDKRIGSRILVSDLSAIVQRSECHFARAFKQTFGEPPHTYLVRRRLELASRMMVDSDALLSDIALTCGFSDQSHLTRLFRQHIGQSPAAWRRERCDTRGVELEEGDGEYCRSSPDELEDV